MVDRVRADGVPGGGRDVRWVRLDGLHLTLRFLGPTLDDRVEPAADAVRRVGREVTAFDVAVQGAGAFPPVGRPRALWLGITEGAGELSTLAAAVDRALADAGWSLDPRPFRAAPDARPGGWRRRRLGDRGEAGGSSS